MNHNTWMTRLLHALLCSAALALSACGGGDAPPPPVPVIGAAGGTVAGPNGTQVVIPAGALSAPVAITITPAAARPLPAGLQALGTVYDLGPAGTTFAVPVTVTLPLNPAQVPAGARIRMLHERHVAGTDTWEELPGLVVGTTSASAQTTSFSHFTLAVGNVPPQITSQPASVSVLAPATASFSVTALGTPPFAYQWQRSVAGGALFVDIAGATTGSYTTGATSVAANNGDNYRVLVSNLEGTSTSSAATLTVTTNVVLPTITTQPQSVSLAPGGSASFSVVASGTNPVYQWQKNGAAIAGQTNASLNLANVQAGDAGSYTVVVSNLINGSAINGLTSNVATLTVSAPPPPATGLGRIAAGSDFSFARHANGDLYSWGSDTTGTLGAGSGDQSRNVPGLVLTSNITAVAAGAAHGLAVRGTGEVRGWGYNGFGQLGDGSFLTREAPTGATVDPAGTLQYSDAVEACGGDLHSLVRRSGGTVHAMGYNNEGQLGDGSTSMIGRARGLAVPGITTAVAIACGQRYSLALLADGTVRAWGANAAGQLGDGSTVNRSTPVVVAGLANVIAIAAGQDHSLALRSDGSVWAWGSNVNGKLGDGSGVNRLTPTATLLTAQITAIAASNENSLARRSDGIVLAWGINETGQLGSGSLSPGFRAQPAPVVSLTDVVAIAIGGGGLGHALAVRSDGTVWAWGYNDKGQLGNGSAAPFSATPVQVTGLNIN